MRKLDRLVAWVPWIVFVVIAVGTAGGGSLRGQCAAALEPTFGLQGVAGEVHASIAWDPDGAGPAPTRLVVGGSFTAAGRLVTANIALWDPVTGQWSAFGAGLDGPVYALAVLPNGELAAAGRIPLGVAGDCRVARWTGTSWASVGGAFHSPPSGAVVNALAVLPSGELVAAGKLRTMGSTTFEDVARWDGSAWMAMGPNSSIAGGLSVLTVTSAGALLAAGSGSTWMMQWNGASWDLATAPSGVFALHELPNGHLLAGVQGDSSIVPTAGLWLWDGVSWTSLGDPYELYTIRCIAVQPNGDVLVGGDPNPMRSFPSNLLRWDGVDFTLVTSGVAGQVRTLALLPNGDLVAGGAFSFATTVAVNNVARLSGATWNQMGEGFASEVWVIATANNGDLLAVHADSHVERWNGSVWTGLGQFPSYVVSRDIVETPNGDLFAGGVMFTGTASGLYRRSGGVWSSIPSAAPWVTDLHVLPNGVLAVGAQNANALRFWNGTTWTVPGGGINGKVSAMVTLPNGDLVVGGTFTMPGGCNNIARWDGIAWSGLGSGVNGAVESLAVANDGTIVAGGSFTLAGGAVTNAIARFHQGILGWQAIGGGMNAGSTVESVLVLPDGDIVAAGWFTNAGGTPAKRAARWNGVAWSEFAGGADGMVRALAWMPSGRVVLAGGFTTIDGAPQPFVASVVSTCPATAQVQSAGCPSSGGANVLAAASLPWVEGAFHGRGTGLPTTALGFAVTGLAPIVPALPLAAVLPAAAAGCDLHVPPDLVELLLVANGVARSTVFLPPSPPVLGLTFHHQMVLVEFDPQGQIVASSATNSLALTVGSY